MPGAIANLLALTSAPHSGKFKASAMTTYCVYHVEVSGIAVESTVGLRQDRYQVGNGLMFGHDEKPANAKLNCVIDSQEGAQQHTPTKALEKGRSGLKDP